MTGTTAEALELALWLYRAPSRRAALLERPLPAATGQLIRIASGSPEALRDASLTAGEPELAVLEAVRFYLQQILFHEQADAYRVMGLDPDASHEQIREHHRWLQRWLHPDRRGEDWESVYASRVNQAWSQLRTPQSRQDYDASREAAAQAPLPVPQTAPHTILARTWTGNGGGQRSRNLAIAALLGCLGLVALIALRREEPPQWLETSSAGMTAPADIPNAAAPVPTPLNDSLMREALIREAQVAAPETSESGTASLQSQARPAPAEAQPTELRAIADNAPVGAGHAREARTIRPVAAQSQAMPVPATIAAVESPATATNALAGAGHAREARATRPTPAQSRARPAPTTTAATESPATATNALARASHAREVRATRPVVAQSLARPARAATAATESPATPIPAAIAATTVADPPVDPLLQMREARKRAQQIVAYLADPAARAPPVWNDLDAALNAERLHDRLHRGAADAGRSALALQREHWSLSGDRASLDANYRLTGPDGASSNGRIAIDFVWREQTWLVRSLLLEPVP